MIVKINYAKCKAFLSYFQATSPAVLRSQEGKADQESSNAGTAVVPSSSFDYCAIM